jgi:hypothetical protein
MRLPWISAGVLTAGAVTACVLAAPSVAATPNLITSKQVISAPCVPSGGLSRAQVRAKMTVVNYHNLKGTDWATHMEIKARIEATGPGFNLQRNWASSKSAYLTQDKRHKFYALLSTNSVGAGDWRLHVKFIWHRGVPVKNVTKHLYYSFNTCAGFDLNPTPAPPSANG